MFRLDINVLRFIAVAMVVLFSFQNRYFYGGCFVDVFCHIRFLMSEIARIKLEQRMVIDFYKKRFKRIYPVCNMFYFFFFWLITSTPPSMLKGLFLSSYIYVNIYQNHYLKATSVIFTDAADSFVFLHTWSLSVEWQFYFSFSTLLFWQAGREKFVKLYFI